MELYDAALAVAEADYLVLLKRKRQGSLTNDQSEALNRDLDSLFERIKLIKETRALAADS